MIRLFDFLMLLYPSDFRAEFSEEMRAVFLELARSRRRAAWTETLGMIRGAASEWRRSLSPVSAALGAIVAGAIHLLLYWVLVVGIAGAQPLPTQDPATLDTARAIYRNAFTALRTAKSMDDMRAVSASVDSDDWIGVDRFGRTVLTRSGSEADLKSMLDLPPDRRAAGMDILWAEQDGDRLMVLAWIMPSEADAIDTTGQFGPKGETHRLTRGTLIRDIFLHTPDGWRRFRHDKLVPNGTVLAVDGVPRIVPPLPAPNRVLPGK